VAPGMKIRVAPNRPGTVTGTVEAVTDDSIRIRSSKQETIPREEIVWISVREGHRKKHVASGLKWGAVIGAGLGAVIGAACSGSLDIPGKCFAVFVPLTVAEIAALGALTGAVRPAGGWHEIYRR